MVPVRERGQPDRVFEKESTIVSDQGVRRKCTKCPKYALSKLWCPVRAEQRQPASPACRYGIVLMVSAERKEYQDAKTSS